MTEQEKLDMYANLRIGAVGMHIGIYLREHGFKDSVMTKIINKFYEGVASNDIDISPFMEILINEVGKQND